MEKVQIILELIIVVLGLYIAFFKSYFSEQGKQLALKEHIEELTDKVETVKSEIELITKTKYDLGVSERTTILDYHAKYNDWKNSIFSLYPTVITEDNFMSKEVFFNEVRTKELLAENARARLRLFDNSTELNELLLATVTECIKIRAHTEMSFEQTAFDCRSFYSTMKSATAQDQLELQTDYLEKRKVFMQSFGEDRLAMLEKLVLQEFELTKYLQEKLFKKITK